MSAEAPKIVDPDAKAAPKPDTKELAKPAKASKPRIDCNSENNISEVNNQWRLVKTCEGQPSKFP